MRDIGRGLVQTVNLEGATIGRITLEPGWRWSEMTKPLTHLEFCQSRHIGYVLEGRIRFHSDTDEERDVVAGQAFHVGPGHDAWVVGEEPCVFIDFEGAATYPE